MRSFFDWLAEWFRPWTSSCVPEHLVLPEIDTAGFHAGGMRRAASLSAGENMTFGVFELIGYDEACRANRQWRPSVLLAMEEVSLAFHLVERQRQIAETVSRQNIERLTVALVGYFQRSGNPRTNEQIRAQIESWLAEHAAPDAATVSPVRKQIGVRLPLLYDLRRIGEEVSKLFIGMQGRPATLECLGLILDAELDDSRYSYCTPLNCRTFANTGGDGAHFSLLVEDDAITESSPVVVTAPDSHGRSIILAPSLRDFLCLGARKGYFALGGIPHDPERILNEHLSSDTPPASHFLSEPYQLQVLSHLCDRLGLSPWSGSDRFHTLQQRCAQALRYPPDLESMLGNSPV